MEADRRQSRANVCLLRSLCPITSLRAAHRHGSARLQLFFKVEKRKALLYENNLSLLEQCLSRKQAQMLFQKNYVSEIKNAVVCQRASARGEPFTALERTRATRMA